MSTRYYVTGNTAKGLVNFLDTNVDGIENVFLLKHSSPLFKSKIIYSLLEHYQKDNVELLLSRLGNEYLDGIINREKSLAVLDASVADAGTVVELDKQYPSVQNTGEADIALVQNAYNCFQNGLRFHDELEGIYIEQMDFEHANEYAYEYIDNLLKGVTKHSTKGHMYHRLFGTNTPDGVVNEVPHLIEDIKNVDYIKGRAGTGKSTFMKKIAKTCVDYGFDTEVYHCSFDPNSLDMVLVRELDFCIFDSTDPHEFLPKRQGERVVDLYKEFVAPGTDEKFASEIDKWNTRYKACMKEGVQYLKKSGELLKQAEKNKFNQEDIYGATEYVLQKYIR
ncbi:PRK06851 family protein [Virgibacillus siamensis]|uniref:PRK06851 family protein n=1 Tax=Virgibacillus siamensis TaxID=480071 RepID=A0ABP3QJN8_9BACI